MHLMKFVDTCKDADCCKISYGHCLIYQILCQEMTKCINEWQKGSSIKWLVFEVKSTKKAESAGKKSPDSECSPVHFSHWKERVVWDIVTSMCVCD